MSKQGFSSPRHHYRNRQHALAALTLGLGIVAGSSVLAQSEQGVGQSLMVDVGPCVNIQSTLERFECYESRVDAARNNGDSAATMPVPRESRETVISTPRTEQAQQPSEQASTSTRSRAVSDEASFGLPEPREQQREVKQQELRSTITALRETVPNSHIITLENGQLWRQMRPERYRIQVGHDVRIYPSPFGSSFRLSADELRGFIQVERIE